MASLGDFKLAVKRELGKKIDDPEVLAEAKKRLAAYEASLKINKKGK